MKRFFVACLLVAGGLAVPGWSLADTIALDNDVLKLNGRDGYNYTLPPLPGGTPEVTLQEFTDSSGRSGVYLKMDLTGMYDADTSDSYSKYYVRNWLFNFNPGKDLAALDISLDSTEGWPIYSSADWDVATGSDAFGLRGEAGDTSDDFGARTSLYDVTSVGPTGSPPSLGSGGTTAVTEDHLGLFDIMFSFRFPDSDESGEWEFDIGESATFKITSSNYDVTAADFRFPSAGGNAMTAVGIWPSCENYEAWYSADAPNVVPEPGTMVLLGTGLLGVGAWVRRRGADRRGEDRAAS